MKKIKLVGVLASLTFTYGHLIAGGEAVSDPSPISSSLLDAISGEIENQLSEKWYEKFKLRGYIQNRYIKILDEGNDDQFGNPSPGLNAFNNNLIGTSQGIGIRRGRMIWSGNPTDNLYLYMQSDYNAGSSSGSGTNVRNSTALQARDIYGDLFLDEDQEFRLRFGLSKVPYGFVNLQSSQNRLPMERPQALNSAVEGERDMGFYFVYAPKEVRALFKDLVKDGLRGSGDYGMVNLGVFNGQGINNSDLNGEPHLNARFAYPFKFGEDQIAEVGASYYHGYYVPGVATFGNSGNINIGAGNTGAVNRGGRGVEDSRGAVNAILYPKPFGLEAEWTAGTGPELDMATRTITAQSLSGGYVQAIYRHEYAEDALILPFVRWETFDGARKFATNAPSYKAEDITVGIEWIPVPEFELTLSYSVGDMTNTNDTAGAIVTGYDSHYRVIDYQYLGLQAQLNF